MTLEPRRKFPREVEPIFGYVEQPFLSSTESRCPPWCTLAANLLASQISSVLPTYVLMKTVITTTNFSQLPKNFIQNREKKKDISNFHGSALPLLFRD